MNRYLLLTLLLNSTLYLTAQDCQCTIEEVISNTVTPCNMIVGEVINVETKDELRNAIIKANNEGGNYTILIADGTYQIASTDWYPYITASNMVFRSASGDRDAVILRGSGMVDVAPGTEIGIFAVGDNITIADLTIREVGNHGIATVGDNLYVHNVKIQNTYEQMLKGNNGGTEGSDNGLVQCSLFEYPAGAGPQYYIGGLDIHNGDDWVVRDNIFRNIASPSGSLAEHAIHFWSESSNNTIERNMIYNCDRGVGFGLGGSPNEGGIIRNNMIYNDGTSQFHDVGIGLETSPNTKVYNNTIHIEYPNAIEYRFEATTGVQMTNNITNKLIRSRNGGTATLTTNVTDAEGSWYVDPTAGDLRLNEAIASVTDQGTDLGDEVAVDLDQTIRPSGNAYDIGAQELLIVSSNMNLTHKSALHISPNPANQTVAIHSEIPGTYDVKILDYQGRVVLRYDSQNPLEGIAIDVQQWTNGIYLCVLSDKKGISEMGRIVVLH